MAKAIFVLIALALITWLGWMLIPPVELVDDANDPYLDMHVHVAGIGIGGSGVYVSSTMQDSYKFPIYLRAFGVTRDELEEQGDQIVIQKLSEKIRESRYVDQAVVLAMDGVVDENGELDLESTTFYVPNDYLIEELQKYPNLLFGASINPLRPDALARLDHVYENGAVLIKWIPAIMHFNPMDPRIRPFYERMRVLGLPLLSHAGDENSFGPANNELGNPRLLELALKCGVTVIAAHVGTTGNSGGRSNFELTLEMLAVNPNLYADISSLTQINKLNFLARALETPGIPEKLIYGTDWPLQFFPLVSPLYHINYLSLSEIKAIYMLSNTWDRDVQLKRMIGVPKHIFRRSEELILERKREIRIAD